MFCVTTFATTCTCTVVVAADTNMAMRNDTQTQTGPKVDKKKYSTARINNT